MEETTIDIKIIINIILYRIKWIISSTILGIILAVIITQFFINPKYTSSISLYVKNITESSASNNVDISSLNASQKLVNTYIVILQNDKILDNVASQLSTKYTANQLRGIIKMGAINNTEVLQIQAETESPELSAEICNTMASIAPAELEDIVGGSVSVMGQAKVSNTPSSPNKKMNLLIGAALGFILSVGVVLLIYFLDNTIKDKEDLQTRFDVPVLGEIPTFDIQPKKGKA